MNQVGNFCAWGEVTTVLIITAIAITTSEAQLIVAHRGASEDAPENTLAAFRLAWDQQADAIEGDFYLTPDGQIVAIHDRTTKRTAGQDLDVTQTPWPTLRQLDVGSWKSPKYRGERIPTLDEVLAAVPQGKKILIEVKCGPEIIPALKESLSRSQLHPDQTVVISFNEEVIVKTKREIPAVKAYWLTGFKQDKTTGQWQPGLGQILDTLEKIQADGLDVQGNREVVDADFVRALRDRGLEFHVWTINDPRDAAYFHQLGVDSITTDRPAVLRREWH